MTDATLRIRIEATGQTVPARGLIRVMEKTLTVLSGMDGTLRGRDADRIEWHICGANMESPLEIAVMAHDLEASDHVAAMMEYAVEGFAAIDRKPETPYGFTHTMLAASKDMVSVLGDGIGKLSFAVGTCIAQPTQRVAAHVDELTRPSQGYGTFEGLLEVVNGHSGRKFTIYDRLTGTKIPCTFQEAHRAKLKNALFERVVVSGPAQFDEEGHALSVKAERIELLPTREELPQFFQIPPIEITGGVDPADYVEDMRDNGEG